MSTIIKTTGIVLDYYPVSETSRVVSWLTPILGRMATLIKGSLRPKSAFIGQYDLFYTCELLFYPRPNTHLHLTKECTPIEDRRSLRQDYRAAATASYFTDLVHRISPQEAPDRALYELTNYALQHLHLHGSSRTFFHWFELRVMESMGLSPRLRHCMVCQKPLSPTMRDYRFSTEQGGMLCRSCASSNTRGNVIIGADVFAVLKAWQQARHPDEATRVRASEQQQNILSRILGRFLEYHLEAPFKSREIALEIIRS